MKLALFALVGSLLGAIGLALVDFGRSPMAARVEAAASEPATVEAPAPERSSDQPPAVPSLGIEIGDAAVVERGPVPARVSIPALGLAAEVIPVGVDSAGQFEVPSASSVGWYHHGPRPGGNGAAVLAAHVDYNGEEGAFFRLAELQEGDLVSVDFDDGTTSLFRVSGQALYDKQSLPAETLFRRDGQPVLHLATCGGLFDPAARSYVGNRVVTAVPMVDSASLAR